MREQQAAIAVSARQPGKSKRSAAEEVIQLSFRLPKSRWKRLRELGLDERASVQSLIVSALEAEFERRGLAF